MPDNKQTFTQKAGKVCGYVMWLWYVGPLLLIGVVCLIIAGYMSKRKYIVMEAIATGETHTITYSKKSEPETKYMVQYVVDGKVYPQLINSGYVLNNGDKVSVYVDKKDPTIVFESNPSKIPSILFAIGFLCLFLSLVATFFVYKYPQYMCGAGGVWALLSW